MQKPFTLSLIACLGLAGCQVFQKSETWNQAVQVRPGETTLDADPSKAYATKLHTALRERGVEHKVVVYQYRYRTPLREEAVDTRTAVIYRDDSNPNYPWWLKDDRLNTPFWLPNGELDKQISFYVQRQAEVLEKKDYPTQPGGGKSVLAFVTPAPALRGETAVAVTETSVVKEPVAVSSVTKARRAGKTSLLARLLWWQRPARTETPPVAPAASENIDNHTPSSPRTALTTKKPAPRATSDKEYFETLFRAKHGTAYNQFSSVDRQKMQQLQNGVATLQ